MAFLNEREKFESLRPDFFGVLYTPVPLSLKCCPGPGFCLHWRSLKINSNLLALPKTILGVGRARIFFMSGLYVCGPGPFSLLSRRASKISFELMSSFIGLTFCVRGVGKLYWEGLGLSLLSFSFFREKRLSFENDIFGRLR